MIKKFFEYYSELNINSSLNKYLFDSNQWINVYTNDIIDIKPSYLEKIKKKYPFFTEKDPQNGSSYLNCSITKGYVSVCEAQDDYFYILILNSDNSYNIYKVDQFTELMRFLNILLKNF